MWKIFAVLVHILLLGFISSIYFQKTIINGLRPQSTHRESGLEPPADRLVVFLIDGLRAETFFDGSCGAVPCLQKMLRVEGVFGVSRGREPTQRRPGHIAIFGGFNEDASAALTNFKWNPTLFDTVLNRTRGSTWAWGAKAALAPFHCLPTDGAPLHLNMFTDTDVKGNTEWINDTVRQFLTIPESLSAVKEKNPSLFVVDFDDLHRPDHVLKPNTEEFQKSLNNTEKVIVELYQLFERTFNDKRTAYLLTSDHGMTDKGTHGGGSQSEVEMPFFFWGAGVASAQPNNVSISNGTELVMHKVDQAQLAPLMSAIIGLPPPINNLAMMPVGIMNVNLKYEAYSMHLNALQMLTLAKRAMEQHERSQIRSWLPRYERLDARRIRNYQQEVFRQLQMGCAKQSIECSQSMIELAQDCLEYHRVYYRIPLVVACVASYLAWFHYLVAKQARPLNTPKQDWITIETIVLLVLEVLVAIVCHLHRVPCFTNFYMLVPLPLWIVALRERGLHCCSMRAPFIQLAWIGGGFVLLVSIFYFKQLIALGYLIVVTANNGRAFTKVPRVKFWIWLVLVALVTGLTVKHPNFGDNRPYLLYVSILVTMLRPLVLGERYAWRVWLSNGGAMLLTAYCVYQRLIKRDVCTMLHATAWGYVCYALISIPYSNTQTPKHRVQLILFNLSTIYTMLSLSFESIFIQLLCSEYLLGVQVHEDYKETSEVEDNEDDEDKPEKSLTPVGHINSSYRYAILILIYIYLSMIGTDQLPNINSLDLSIARVFVSGCSTFLVGTLLLLKLMIPITIIVSGMFAFCTHARQNVCGIIICIFLICDVMCLYFFFFVRNSGSWHNVRDSLSQQIIVHGLPMMVAMFSWLPKQFLSAIPLTTLPMLRWNSVVQLPRTGQSLA